MARRPVKSRNISVYSNLTHKRRSKKDAASRKKAEYLASLPKDPVRRILYRLHPRRFWGYWFSKKGAIMTLKIAGVGILFMFLMVGALFAYYRKDLDSIKPGQLASRVQTTVTRYYDRNNTLLWEDKGSGNYKLVVNGDEINNNMKNATLAIEDKDFYKHGAISVSSIIRSAVNNSGGGTAQGGSTLTQQLVKQVFFAPKPGETLERGIGGIPRKIKEMILSVEVERMYNKKDILNLYLNESPYGGRRNGVESAARTYFGISAKDLTVPQASLLAAIPNQPGLYNPYNVPGHEALIRRQHKVIDNMLSEGYIKKTEADAAKAFPILDHINPETSQFKDIKAPHFVQMVRQQLEKQLGKATVGQGGLNITTTLDLKVQDELQARMTDMFAGTNGINCFGIVCPDYAGFKNGAAAVEDTQTGQLIAMVGSRNFEYEGFGQDNAAAAFIQPGSSIKPFVYAQLFQNQGQGKQNYGSGSVLSDIRTTFPGNYTPQNAGGPNDFRGNLSIRNGLDLSRNIPAIKAMAIAGKEPTWKTIRDLGNKDYCTQGPDADAGLSSAIGGCGTRLVDHTNALASLARMGVYKPQSTVLKVTNSKDQVLQQYKDESKQVLDPQAAYVVNDILGDGAARSRLANQSYTPTLDRQGIKVAAKTGTSDSSINGKVMPKDIWTVGYTPHLSMAVWLGNPDTTPLRQGNSLIPAKIFDPVMAFATQHYIEGGKAKASDWFTVPAGIQRFGNEVFPSYYNRAQGVQNANMTFDKVSKKKATTCTPAGARVDVAVSKTTDPYTKKEVITAPDGYDATKDDDTHVCGDAIPSVGSISTSQIGNSNKYKISVTVTGGKNPLQSVEIKVGGAVIATLPASGSSYSTTHTFTTSGAQTISVVATDSVFYTDEKSISFTPDSD